MSWILGSVGSISEADIHHISNEAPQDALVEFKTPHAYVLAGGIAETCFSGHLNEQNHDAGFWIVCGLGIGVASGSKQVLRQENWQRVIKLEPSEIQNTIEGQYCIFIVRGSEAVWLSDRMGSRDLFWASIEDRCVISTRIDLVSRVKGGARLNTSSFSARWSFFNQLSNDSILQEIGRLGPCGVATCHNSVVSASRQPWNPNANQIVGFTECLDELLQAPFESGMSLTLGLSGGLDSRLLFALLLGAHNSRWDVHTFGDPMHPDAMVAQEIARDFNITHFHLDQGIPTADESIAQMEDFAAHSMMRGTASAFIQLHNYESLYVRDRVLTDGSFGELGRRHMLKRLALRGSKAIEEKAFEKMFPLLRRKRGDFFSHELTRDLHRLALEELVCAANQLPDPVQFGVENWIDLFVIRYHISNANAAEQARMDHFVPNYMPFVQSSLLNEILHVPVTRRKNGKLFREIVRNKERRLAQYPLVGVDATYPFILPPVPAFIYRKIKTKVGLGIKYGRHISFLHHIKEYVADTLLSDDALSCGYYDRVKVRNIVNGYYAGNESLGTELDWLLAFDMWRRRVMLQE